MERVAQQALERRVAMADPHVEKVKCHLFPCLDPERRGALCYAPGKYSFRYPSLSTGRYG